MGRKAWAWKNRALKAALLTIVSLVVGACSAGKTPDQNTVAEGSTAPAFALPAADGKTVSLSDYRDKQAVLLFFSMGPG